MSTAIHLDRGLILLDGGAVTAAVDNKAVNNKAKDADPGDARQCNARQPSAHQESRRMPRPLWVYYERL